MTSPTPPRFVDITPKIDPQNPDFVFGDLDVAVALLNHLDDWDSCVFFVVDGPAAGPALRANDDGPAAGCDDGPAAGCDDGPAAGCDDGPAAGCEDDDNNIGRRTYVRLFCSPQAAATLERAVDARPPDARLLRVGMSRTYAGLYLDVALWRENNNNNNSRSATDDSRRVFYVDEDDVQHPFFIFDEEFVSLW